MMYKLYKNSYGQDNIVKTNEDGSITSFGQNADNTDYQQYLQWLEQGNTPEPAENQ